MAQIGETGEVIKNALSYSQMTDRVYWVNGKSQKTNVTDQFYYVLGAMADHGGDRGFKLPYKNAGFMLNVIKFPLSKEYDEENGADIDESPNHHLRGRTISEVFISDDEVTIHMNEGLPPIKLKGIFYEEDPQEI